MTIRKFYNLATPYVQVVGFIILCAFIVGTKYHLFEAEAATIGDHELRIMKLETSTTQVNQKLDDIMMFWRIPQHR